MWTCGNGVVHQSFISGFVLGCVFVVTQLIKKKKSHSGQPGTFPYQPSSTLALKSLVSQPRPDFSCKAAASEAWGSRRACHSPRGRGAPGRPAPRPRGLKRLAGPREGRPEGRRPRNATAVDWRVGPSPRTAPPARGCWGHTPRPTRPRLQPRPRLSPCGGRVASSAAARLRVAQRPTGPRTAGEARDRWSHPCRCRLPTRNCQHRASGLRECRTPETPRPHPRPIPVWTPPSRARAPRARARPRPPGPECAGASLLGPGPTFRLAPAAWLRPQPTSGPAPTFLYYWTCLEFPYAWGLPDLTGVKSLELASGDRLAALWSLWGPHLLTAWL